MKKLFTLSTAIISTLVSFSPLSAQADNGDITFTRETGNGTISTFGSKKAETYDVAILLTNSSLKGKTIKSVTIPFHSKDNLSNLKVWLSKKLTLETINGKKTNVPDAITQDVTLTEDTITVNFATPYTIEGDSIYIGYTFDSSAKDDNSKTPILLTSEKAPSGFLIHSSRTYRSWVNYSTTGSLAIKATLGNVNANDANVAPLGLLRGAINQPQTVDITLTNLGYNGVKDIDYTYEAGSLTGTSHVDLTETIPAIFGATADVTISLPGQAAKGNYPVKITVNKINGTDNTAAISTTTDLEVYSLLPKHRAVLEEYTGTWCGYCPRGLVGLEVMNRLYPDDFIGLSYHNGDPMTIMTTKEFPSKVEGFPDAWLDRTYETDAYYGNSYSFGIDKVWKTVCSTFTPAEISAEAKMSADGSKISAKATTTFIKDLQNEQYKIEFVLLSDSLTGNSTDWGQSNYYANGSKGKEETFPEPEFATFYNGESIVNGIYFPDVVIATSRLETKPDNTIGNDVPLPTEIKADTPMESVYEFNLEKVRNTDGTRLVQKKNTLRVVAILVDKSGKIINGAKAPVNIDDYRAGINQTKTGSSFSTPIKYYDLSGRRITDTNRKGIFIAKDAHGNTIKTVRR